VRHFLPCWLSRQVGLRKKEFPTVDGLCHFLTVLSSRQYLFLCTPSYLLSRS
jgi:hypothetical protein